MNIIIFNCILSVLQARIAMGIMGGQPAQPRQFKNVVALQTRVNGYYETFCSGAIIAKYWVLTSGTCIQVIEEIFDPLENVVIVAGTVNVTGRFPQGQYLKIRYFTKHENFVNEGTIVINDLGMIKVRGAGFKETDDVAIYPLASSDDVSTGYTVLIGWGALKDEDTDRRNYPDTLQMLTADFLYRGTCKQLLSNLYENNSEGRFNRSLVTDQYHCTGPLSEGHSICNGDAGGPLTKTDSSGKHHVIGIISKKFGHCGQENTPTLHTNVAQFKSWIKKNTFRIIFPFQFGNDCMKWSGKALKKSSCCNSTSSK